MANTLEWIFKAEQSFDYYDTPDSDRLIIAAVHLDQEVIPWFQMMQRSNPFQSWQAFTRAIELDFGPSVFDCPRATLFKLMQTGSVCDYYREFTSLANRVYGLSPEALLDCFISGLQDTIRRDVMVQSPITLLKAVALAKLFEEKYQPLPKSPYSAITHKTTPTNSLHQTRFPGSKPSLPPLLPTPNTKPFNPTHKSTNIKRITPAEIQVRKDKVLCYYCDEKFSFTHNCPNKHLLLLQVDEDTHDEPEPDPPGNTQTDNGTT